MKVLIKIIQTDDIEGLILWVSDPLAFNLFQLLIREHYEMNRDKIFPSPNRIIFNGLMELIFQDLYAAILQLGPEFLNSFFWTQSLVE